MMDNALRRGTAQLEGPALLMMMASNGDSFAREDAVVQRQYDEAPTDTTGGLVSNEDGGGLVSNEDGDSDAGDADVFHEHQEEEQEQVEEEATSRRASLRLLRQREEAQAGNLQWMPPTRQHGIPSLHREVHAQASPNRQAPVEPDHAPPPNGSLYDGHLQTRMRGGVYQTGPTRRCSWYARMKLVVNGRTTYSIVGGYHATKDGAIQAYFDAALSLACGREGLTYTGTRTTSYGAPMACSASTGASRAIEGEHSDSCLRRRPSSGGARARSVAEDILGNS
jgi:hypothetical protein